MTLAATATSTTTVTFSPDFARLRRRGDVDRDGEPVSPLTGTPTGTVNFYNGTTLLGIRHAFGGVASCRPRCSRPAPTRSRLNIRATALLRSSTSPVTTVTVAKVATTTAVTFSPSTPDFRTERDTDSDITPASTGAAAPTGTVTFYNGTTSLGTETVSSGVATFSTTALPAGTTRSRRSMAGDSNYAGQHFAGGDGAGQRGVDDHGGHVLPDFAGRRART